MRDMLFVDSKRNTEMSDKTVHATQEWILVNTDLFERELKVLKEFLEKLKQCLKIGNIQRVAEYV